MRPMRLAVMKQTIFSPPQPVAQVNHWRVCGGGVWRGHVAKMCVSGSVAATRGEKGLETSPRLFSHKKNQRHTCGHQDVRKTNFKNNAIRRLPEKKKQKENQVAVQEEMRYDDVAWCEAPSRGPSHVTESNYELFTSFSNPPHFGLCPRPTAFIAAPFVKNTVAAMRSFAFACNIADHAVPVALDADPRLSTLFILASFACQLSDTPPHLSGDEVNQTPATYHATANVAPNFKNAFQKQRRKI